MSREELRADSPDDSSYNNVHRAFLQAFLVRPSMTADEIKPILAAVNSAHQPQRPMLEGDVTSADISSTIATINTRLSPLDYEIRSTRSQTDRTLVYALVNTTSDALTQLSTTFSADEIAYVKRLLDAMFETNNTRLREVMAVGEVQASSLARVQRRESGVNGTGHTQTQHDEETEGTATAAAKSLTLSDAERVLAELVAQSFLSFSPRTRFYSLAPRALIELRTYLKDAYNEPADADDADDEGVIRIRDCEGCREIVTVGRRCRDKECKFRAHDHCAMQFFRNVREDERKCPLCKTEWTGGGFVGERAAGGTQRRTTAGGRGGRRRAAAVEAEDEDEEMEE
ncbi:Nse1 non-SMC component of SMC5-6 complex-domain-containing protein [Clohesyomyces aquaticus]|uniref:Non-structural maintenance of chromosomes element 1 homolog n=1 Tax=Clohesyomyces aquaticus TaxID=1231657 RepID=A0A1Y1ZX05_9PLEO|nr:Nse1 non-SMC component of SMC5-6 complex-domain-containing protein [Clohesyomyces aquaticus]